MIGTRIYGPTPLSAAGRIIANAGIFTAGMVVVQRWLFRFWDGLPGVRQRTLSRLFHKSLGRTVHEMLTHLRLERAKVRAARSGPDRWDPKRYPC